MAEQLTKAEYLASLKPLPEQNIERGDCAICYEILTEATQTPCGHIFCLECLKLWVNENEVYNSRCPTCRVTLYSFEEEPGDEEHLTDIAETDAEREAEVETTRLQLSAMDNRIIIQGSVLHELTHEYVQSVRDRDLVGIDFGEEEDPLGFMVLDFPDFMDQLLEHDARYAFYWRYSVMAFGFLQLTVRRQDVGDDTVLRYGDIHPMNDLASRVQDFFNAQGNGGMTSIIVQRAIERERIVDAEYECQFLGPRGISLEA